jgi:hypothetical protein
MNAEHAEPVLNALLMPVLVGNRQAVRESMVRGSTVSARRLVQQLDARHARMALILIH